MAQGLLDTPLGAAVQELWASKCTRLDVPVPTTPTLLAVLSIPHFLYAFIWIVPKYWNAWFGKQAADVLAYLGVFCKREPPRALASLPPVRIFVRPLPLGTGGRSVPARTFRPRSQIAAPTAPAPSGTPIKRGCVCDVSVRATVTLTAVT